MSEFDARSPSQRMKALREYYEKSPTGDPSTRIMIEWAERVLEEAEQSGIDTEQVLAEAEDFLAERSVLTRLTLIVRE
jgi:hypothetical protein